MGSGSSLPDKRPMLVRSATPGYSVDTTATPLPHKSNHEHNANGSSSHTNSSTPLPDQIQQTTRIEPLVPAKPQMQEIQTSMSDFAPLRPQMQEVQTSMSDFADLFLGLHVSNDTATDPPPPVYEIPSCSQEVQTDPWEPDAAKIQPQQQQGLEFARVEKKQDGLGVEDIWIQVQETCEPNADPNLVVKRSGWKTVRIFVSSTFKDFHYEREVLIKEVFPDLRVWCEQRRLHLVECDLRWGVPKDSTSETTLKTCLGEIDRCYQDNIMPFFVNMTSERIGWIPLTSEVPRNLCDEYRWVFGLSMTEMEIVHGAYRKDNPNSIFMMRDGSFIESVPAEHRKEFIDEQEMAPEKLEKLKKMISNRFPADRIVHYKSEYEGIDPVSHKLRFELDNTFRTSVFEFFKKRIEQQYPLYDGDEDPLEKSREAHESFMKSRGESVLGRQDILTEIDKYVCGDDISVPFLILGQPGTGKSSIMAKAADDTTAKALQRQIPHGDKQGWHVFYHFVGAVPGSTDLFQLLCRLLKEINAVDATSMPTDLDNAVGVAVSALNNPATRPVILFVDALNQLDEEFASQECSWVPRKLPPNVRCVFSMINSSMQHENLLCRETAPKELFVSPLSLTVRKEMVTEVLGKFNKKLDMDQMIDLLSKTASENPLWLSIACEELRVFGNFREVSNKINHLPDGLLDLLTSVLSRFEAEGGGHLLVATLCLIEVSTFGLLESELLSILADEDNLLPPDMEEAYSQEELEKGDRERSEKESKKKKKQQQQSEQQGAKEEQKRLPAMKWAAVYRSLKSFLRPFGDSGEGRLDFYHRTLSKVVRKKYLKQKVQDADTISLHPNAFMGDGEEEEEVSPTYQWWHGKLADFFQASDMYERKVEEYPYHLLKLKDYKRLEVFLCEWGAIDILYDHEYSGKLLKYWKPCGGFEEMTLAYSTLLQEFKEKTQSQEEISRRYVQMGRILMQAGQLDQALELATEALRLEEQLGNNKMELAEIYELLGGIWDQKTKLHEFCTRDQVPEVEQCMNYQSKNMEILRQFSNEKKYKHKLGKALIGYAFSLASLADCGGSEEFNVSQAIQTGENSIDEAMKILKELKDNGKLAEAYMTKAVLCRNSKTKQIQLYKEAEELCRQAYGDYHPLMARINLNTGICHEDSADYQTSYDYFKQNLTIALEVYGKDHTRAKRSLGILSEPMYARIAKQRGDEFPTAD